MENINNNVQTQNKSILRDFFANNDETKVRVGYKDVEERIKDEARNIRGYAPLTKEERLFISMNETTVI